MRLPRDLSGEEVAKQFRVGTLDAIVTDIAEFLGLSKSEVRDTLFG